MSSTVDDWEDAGLVEVLLPSGRSVRGKLPDLADLAARQLIPFELVAWVLKVADPAWLTDPEPDPTVDDDAVQGYLDQLVVLFVKQVQVEDEWVNKTLDPARLDRLPDGERHTLELVVAYRLTPEEAWARSAAVIRGEDPDAEEGETGVDRLLPFREGDDGPAAGEDGGQVAPAAVATPRPARRRRVPGGRGAGGQAGPRDAGGVEGEAEVGNAAR